VRSRRTRWGLVAQAALAQASWVGVRIVLGYAAVDLGGGPLLVSVLAASFAGPALLSAVPAGRLSDRVGGGVVTVGGLLIAGAGSAVVLLSPPSAAALIMGAVILGAGQLLVMVGQQTYVAHSSSPADRDAGFGTLSAAASLGQLVGPPAVTWVATGGGAVLTPDTRVGLTVCLCLSTLALPFALLMLRSTARPRPARSAEATRILPLLRTPELWRTLLAGGAVLVTVDVLYSFLPLWAVERDVPATMVGLLLAVRAIVSVASRLGLGRLVARFGRRALIVVAMASGSVALAALPLVDVIGAFAVMVLLGVALGVPQPLTMAWTTAITPPRAHGAALGLRLAANRAAQITLPLSMGAIAAPFGIAPVFWMNAIVLTAGTVVVISARTVDDRGSDGTEDA